MNTQQTSACTRSAFATRVMNRLGGLLGACMFALCAQSSSAAATLVTFDGDVIGAPPAVGGGSRPTSLVLSGGTSILVQPSADGIGTKPAVISADAPGEFAGMFINFSPVASGVVRVEAQVGFSRYIDAMFLQTASYSPVVTRLDALSNGTIVDDASRTVIGTYQPNHAFGVRMDVDMSGKTWSAAVDNELDGFADDSQVSGLPFSNPSNVLPNVSMVVASLSIFPTKALGGSVAYDNIRIASPAPVPLPAMVWLFAAGAAGVLKGRLRRHAGCRQ